LGTVPGIIAFPVNGILIIMITAVIGLLFWKEKLMRQQYIFLGLSVLVLVFIRP